MSSDWPVVKLGELADFQEGYVNPSQREPAYFDGDIKWLRATDLNDSLVVNTSRTLSEKGFKSAGKSSLLFEPGTLAISKSGTIGRVGILGDYMCGNRAVINIKPKAHANPRYLFFVLRHLRPIIETLAEGSVQRNLYVSTLSNLYVPAPRKETQDAIAEYLGALDDRIMLLRETNKTLESIAQAIFKSWFVDFDPVRAKMEGRQPEGMDEATAALFPDSFEESELGLIPRGWKVKTAGETISALGGATPNTKTSAFWTPEEFHWTTPKDLSGAQSPVLLDTERRISAEGLAKISSGLLPAGTLLMSSRAPIGYLTISRIPVAINQGYIAMPPGGELAPLFMYFWCKTNMETIKGHANGSTFMEISKKAFRPIPIVVPSPGILDSFTQIADILFNKISINTEQANTLSSVRDTLLPRLISGQLRLPEEQELREAALP